MGIKRTIWGAMAITLSIAIFAQTFYVSMKLTRDAAMRERMKTEEADTVSSVVVSCKAAPALAAQEASETVGVARYDAPAVYTGWDGRTMEAWEMDLFVRISYLEFWGTSSACCEAGVDSILRLWESGEYGDTMGELLTAEYAPGYYVYSPMAYVWDWEYDAEGLRDMRQLCEERFYNGPVWIAPYFRLWYYHEWAVPCYEIDGVYFSTSPWVQ